MAKTTVRAISTRALALLMVLEGFRAMPYVDIAGVWTDGYGNTHNVVPGRPVTEEQAKATLIKHTEQFGSQVLKCLDREPTQGQYDAFVLAALNFGAGAPGKASGFAGRKMVGRLLSFNDSTPGTSWAHASRYSSGRM